MTLDDLLSVLTQHPKKSIQLMLPDGSLIPAHFHVTEAGLVRKEFVDCGGTVRSTSACVLQIWVAQDINHRLDTTKLAHILQLASPLLRTTDLPVEIEYETTVISQYPLVASEMTSTGLLCHLAAKHTACLAPQLCVIESGQCDSAKGCC